MLAIRPHHTRAGQDQGLDGKCKDLISHCAAHSVMTTAKAGQPHIESRGSSIVFRTVNRVEPLLKDSLHGVGHS